MLRLAVAAGPRWLDLGFGVRVEVVPMSSELRIRASQDFIAGGGSFEGDAAEMDAVSRDIAYTKTVAKRAITGWEGVEGPEGGLAEVTAENVDALLDLYEIYHQFQAQYLMAGLLVRDEGNGSAPSPNGTSAVGATTVEPAPPPAAIAPES